MRILIIVSSILFLCALTNNAFSQTNEKSTLSKWLDSEYMTGGWGGKRKELVDKGITFFGNYHTTFLGNPVGGESNGFEYAGQLVVGSEFDLEKIAGVDGLRFVVSGTWITGRSLSEEHIGNEFDVSEVFNLNLGFTFGADSYRLYQLFLEQSLFGDKLNVAAGRMATLTEFATLDVLEYYVNTAFNANAGSIKKNIPTITPDPFSAWGVRIKIKPANEFYIMSGVYTSNPDNKDADNNGLDFSFDGGALWLGEIGYSPKVNISKYGLPGTYKLGMLLDTSEFDVFGKPGKTKSDNFGFYSFMQQMLYKENNVDNQGLIFFSVITYSPQEEINSFPFYYAGGLAYVGLIKNRNNDKTGFGFLIGDYSDDLPEQDYESVLELTYKLEALKWLIVQPQIQYVLHPSGREDIDDALVLGFKFEVEL